MKQTPRSGHWKPASLKAPVLGAFIVVFVVLIAIIEYLSQKAKKNGALVYAPDVDSFTTSAKFGFLFLPTIIAVIVTMVWTWIDLDTKRIEPWFQLSTDGGAKAENSLLLAYPYMFGPIAPFVALRRRHWAILLASTSTLLLLLIVVPFQSAMFNTATLTRKIDTEMRTLGALLPLEQQSANLNYNMYFDIFGIVWNKQKTLPFTTPGYAILPFKPVIPDILPFTNELWTTETQAFSASLDCTGARISSLAPTPGVSSSFRLEQTNGNCSIIWENPSKPTSRTYMQYMGYWKYGQQNNQRGLESDPGCSDKINQRTFLAISTTNTSFNAETDKIEAFTALFCTPKYHVQTINITVNASSSAVVNMTAVSELSDMPQTLFNTTHLEYLISSSNSTGENTPLMLLQGSKMFHAGVLNTRDPAAFAAGLNQSALPNIMEPAVLKRSFEQMHQLMFSQAFSTLTRNVEDGSTHRGSRIDTPGAIIFVRTFATIVDMGLGLVILMIAGLWFVTFKRQSKLPGDPSSIGNMMSLVPYVGNNIGSTDGKGLTALDLENHLKGKMFQLVVDQGETKLVSVRSQSTEIDTQSHNASNDDTLTSQDSTSLPPIRASTFSLFYGLFLLCFLGGLMATIIALQNKTEKGNGIKLPTTNKLAKSFLTNFVPTLFATLLEPLWLNMNRLLAMLRPFEELRTGSAKYFRSIGATYSSLPPPLVVYRALRSHHFVLVGVCFATILTNVLAVSFAGLFEEKIVSMGHPLLTSQTLLPSYTGRNIINLAEVGEARNKEQRDHLYYADSYYTRGNSLPPWVGQDYYFLPFELPSLSEIHNSSAESVQGFKASTYGLGVDVSCKPLVRDAADFGIHFEAYRNGTDAEYWISHILANSSKATCQFTAGLDFITLGGAGIQNAERLSYNLLGEVIAANVEDYSVKYPFCTDLFVMGWVRFETELVNKTTSVRQFKKSSDNHVGEGTFLGCTPTPRVAKFDVVVDSEGFVLESTKLFDVADSDKFFDIPQIDPEPRPPFLQFGGTLNPSPQTLRNSTVIDANDWINKFLNALRNSTTLTDPNFPAPSASEIAPLVEKVYRQLFALVVMTNDKTIFANSTGAPILILGATLFNETRLFLNPIMYKLSLAVLAFQFCIALLFYLRRPKMFLHRLPLNIASILVYLDSSRAKQELGGDSEGIFGAKQQLFRYGNYEGTDKKIREGIEIQEYVITPAKKEGIVSRTWQGVFGKEKNVVVETREVDEPTLELKH